MKDLTAIALSVVCIFHCLMGPIALGLGLSGAWGVASDPHHITFHLMIFFPAMLLVLLSLPRSYKRHRNTTPLLLGGSGILSLFLSLLVEVVWHAHDVVLVLSILGGTSLFFAHMVNRTKLRNLDQISTQQTVSES